MLENPIYEALIRRVYGFLEYRQDGIRKVGNQSLLYGTEQIFDVQFYTILKFQLNVKLNVQRMLNLLHVELRVVAVN